MAAVVAISLPASAEDDYDPLDYKAVLAQVEKSALEQGGSALTDVAKQLLGRAIDAYIPGLSAILGLGGPNETQQVLDAIMADGDRTRDVVLDFWRWAYDNNAATINADYASVEYALNSYLAMDVQYRLTNRAQLAAIVNDCVSVMAKLQAVASPLERIDRLHAYATLLDLTMVLEAERSELEILGGAWEVAASGVRPEVWWENLSDAEREQVIASIQSTKLARIRGLLLPGLEVGFSRQMNAIDSGTLVGGVPGQSDFVTARDWQFGELKYVPGGPSTWVYYVGRDLQGHCVNTTRDCKAYFITQGSTSSTQGPRYFVEFDGGSGPFYPSADAAYQEHKALVLKDMIVRGYGPVRGFAETWWDVWGLGDRHRLGLDDAVDGYLDSADGRRTSSLAVLLNSLTYDITPGEKSFLYGFALSQGLTATEAISGAATRNPDFLATPVNWFGQTWTKFPWWIHRNAIRLWPATEDVLALPYRGLPAAKFVALNGLLQ